MRGSPYLYSLVAERCPQYKMRFLDSLISVGDEPHSCTNCKNFSSNEYCRIDLYDTIASTFDYKGFNYMKATEDAYLK